MPQDTSKADDKDRERARPAAGPQAPLGLMSQWLVNSIDIGVIVLDRDLRIIMWNDYMEKYAMRKRSTVLGRKLGEIYTTLADETWTKRFRQVLEQGSTLKFFNYAAILKEGQTSDEDTSAGILPSQNILLTALRDDDWRIHGVVLTMEDVTERRHREDRFFKIIDNAADGIFILDEDGVFRYITTGALESLGFEKGDIVGKFFADVIATEDFEKMAKAFATLNEKRIVRGLECDVMTKKGERITVEIAAKVIDIEKDKTSILGQSRVVTERKKREEEMHQSLELNASVIEGIPVAIAVLDKGLNIVTANASFHKFFHTSGNACRGMNILEIIPMTLAPTEAVEERVDKILSTLKIGEPHKEENVPTKDLHGPRRLDVAILPPAKGRERVVAIIEDVTERWNLDLQKMDKLKLETEFEKLKEVDNLKSEFISVASHELRTPLAGLRVYLSRMSKGAYGPLSDEHARKVDTVIKQVEFLINIVETMLETSRIESGVASLAPKDTDMAKLIDDVLQKVLVLSEGIPHKISVYVPDGIPYVNVDAERLSRVFSNLINNAITYSPNGGHIEIRVADQDADLVVSVSDEGIGVPDALKEKIFERFFVVDKSLTRRCGGMGLGLAIARGIVEEHGGRIWVEDRKPRPGSVFKFTIPKKSRENL